MKMPTGIPPRLLDAVAANKLVPFVGAGISKKTIPGQFPSWSELVAELCEEANRLRVISSIEKKEVTNLIKQGKLTIAAEIVKSVLPADALVAVFDKRFVTGNLNSVDLRTQILILKIASRIVLTTNYDTLLEDAFARHFRFAGNVVTYRDPYSVQNTIQSFDESGPPLVFKIHGTIRDRSSIVLSERDYRSLMFDHEANKTVISTIFMSNVLLFLGFSMNDREVLFHLERMRHQMNYLTQPHFALVAKNHMSGSERKYLRESLGVETIEYDPAHKHAEIDQFLSRLIKVKK
jgi:hypothetical protein